MNNSNPYKRQDKTGLYLFLIRWWSAGAIYFLVAWGTQLGRYSSLIDLVFFLGLSIGLANTFLVNPIIKMLFNVGWHKSYGSSTYKERFICRVKDITLGFVSTLLVMGIYSVINRLGHIFSDLPAEEAFLNGEPILYGLFYAVVMFLILSLIGIIKKRK